MFMTTKISWNQFNRMPHDTFNWKGMDGTEVLTHFITTPEPWNEPGSWFYTYNGLLTAKTVKGVWDAYSEKEMNKDLLISYGYGDGGGGVNRDLLEARRIDKIPGLPNLKTGTAGEYFRNLKETVKNTDQYVHTWDGELYLEYHRGTYTSQGYNKRMNRKMELLYRKAEWLTAMKALREGNLGEAQQEKLTEGWKMILTNQFHDIIPGSSIHEVYEDSRRDYEKVRKIGEEVAAEAEEAMTETYYEAAVLDGASKWQQIKYITIPLLKPVITILLIMAVGGIFKADFGLFYQLPMNSGPLYPVTNVLDTYIFRALQTNGEIGMSSAAALFQSTVGFVLIMIANKIVSKVDSENALF